MPGDPMTAAAVALLATLILAETLGLLADWIRHRNTQATHRASEAARWAGVAAQWDQPDPWPFDHDKDPHRQPPPPAPPAANPSDPPPPCGDPEHHSTTPTAPRRTSE